MDITKPPTWSFLIVAGGSGSRMGGLPKQFRTLGGMPVWKWSAKIANSMYGTSDISELVIVVSDSYADRIAENCAFTIPTKCVRGGKTRSESVMNGLKMCSGSHVLVHDAARPFLTKELCLKLMDKCLSVGAAVPLLESSDSLKCVDGETVTCIDRSKIYRTQTPQAFDRLLLLDALNSCDDTPTDDAYAWTLNGNTLGYIIGEENNFKITTRSDWDRAKYIAGGNRMQRTGHGFDIHKLVPNRKLILAGVEIKDSPVGLLGHSDADVICHTVMDAMLGAAGEPDIGTLFPASDIKWKDAVSTELLKYVVSLLHAKAWRIEWVDITLIAQTPRLGNMVESFKISLSKYIAEDDSERNVNIKIKSGEECGSVGRSECIVCHAVATLSKN